MIYEESMKIYHFIHILSVCLFILFGLPENSWALQSHSAPEGIYVHQMAHLLFMGALGYLYWHTRKSPAIKSKGWKYLQIFCFFLIAWNLIAFTGHQAFGQLTPADFIDKSSWKEQLAPPITWIKVLYYFTKMDHFLNVPGLFALVISLRTFYHEALMEENR
ncbi:MAG: hypothetical protein COA36_14365 [Desulfotalea sp.]|nr:MAG: hypothetical protein COA36_14365 [Desulfotalea sp.]